MPDLTRTDVTQALRAVLAERTAPDAAVAAGAKQVEAALADVAQQAAARTVRASLHASHRALFVQIGAYLIILDQIVITLNRQQHLDELWVSATFAFVSAAVLISIALTIRDLRS